MSTDRTSINPVTNPISFFERSKHFWDDLLILFINLPLLQSNGDPLISSLLSGWTTTCTFPLLWSPLWLSVATLFEIAEERVKMCTTNPRSMRESPWQRGKTVIRSDVIVCGLNTSSHVPCHETLVDFVSTSVGALTMMTLCTGLMNNLDGITSALVALQLLPLCSSSPWCCTGYYWSGPIVLRSWGNYEGPVCTLIHLMKITIYSQGSWGFMSLEFYDGFYS